MPLRKNCCASTRPSPRTMFVMKMARQSKKSRMRPPMLGPINWPAAWNEAKSPSAWPRRSGATVEARIAAASGFAIARPRVMNTRIVMSCGNEMERAVSPAPTA